MKTTHEETEEHLTENAKELKEKMECGNFGGVGDSEEKSVKLQKKEIRDNLKTSVVQRMYMHHKQKIDRIDREDSEWPATSTGGSGAGLSGTCGESLLEAWTEMERLMRKAFGFLWKVAYETANVLFIPPARL
ncbi:uncharacterized protein MONOS_10714 [Monocercomonoides exilis]|uniref:uncharacterized protein n=1 Tax=Monocercomonoides exilis TaxID=2049356 RepID=UPI00355995A4|nr:hypothetical protein MONOS_10714 [Monocercomonoides exilis]|eukprot:MONOS_10714.1-p1 / transcript=MONOS_10714.1 / gene=MONOS_10714 / organism=Monocercomonoides_exilis_PA203 / gene_product=unspecified product / transcript_product=unspecified product / location=Mono_scaffold00497:35015-35508(-) / protein_length=133 / sequence_SO=supercontig / SO=protein_coding / is_pseudo=false